MIHHYTGIVGSILCILAILAIAVHIVVFLKNKKTTAKTQRRRSVTASNHDSDTMSRNMYILAFITLALFILTPISQTFLRCNFIVGTAFDPSTTCSFAYSLYYFPYSLGQYTLSTLFLYRLHVTFYKSQYKIRRKTNIAIAVGFGVMSITFALILQLGPKEFVNKVEFTTDPGLILEN